MGSANDPGRVIATWLVIGGVVAIVVGVISGSVIEPYLYSIAAVALIDFVLAWAFASGRIGPTAQRSNAATGTAAQEAELDPSYNPYARED